jgi:hypothetical protein
VSTGAVVLRRFNACGCFGEASVIRDAAKRLIQKAEEYEHHAAKALSPAVSEILMNLAWGYRACAKRMSFMAEKSHAGETDDSSGSK